MDLPANPTYAFWSMLESQGELRAYANLFILQPEHEDELKKPEHLANRILEMWKVSSTVAGRLGTVYLVAVMEAYSTDVVLELLDRRIREVNQELLDQAPPTNEDDDIMNEIHLEEAETNKDNPFHLFAEITKNYIRNQTRQDTLKNMIDVLERLFRYCDYWPRVTS